MYISLYVQDVLKDFENNIHIDFNELKRSDRQKLVRLIETQAKNFLT